MNPIARFLLNECAATRAGFLVIPGWKLEDFAYQESAFDSHEAIKFKKRMVKEAATLGIQVL